MASPAAQEIPLSADTAALSALSKMALGLCGQRGGDLSYGSLKEAMREAVGRDPIDALLVTALGSAYLFWLAEKDQNPKCQSFWDALVFTTTALSVGYADIFARTEAGKAIAAFLMTFGPSLAAKAFDPPARPQSGPSPEEVLIAKLDAILEALKRLDPAARPV